MIFFFNKKKKMWVACERVIYIHGWNINHELIQNTHTYTCVYEKNKDFNFLILNCGVSFFNPIPHGGWDLGPAGSIQ